MKLISVGIYSWMARRPRAFQGRGRAVAWRSIVDFNGEHTLCLCIAAQLHAEPLCESLIEQNKAPSQLMRNERHGMPRLAARRRLWVCEKGALWESWCHIRRAPGFCCACEALTPVASRLVMHMRLLDCIAVILLFVQESSHASHKKCIAHVVHLQSLPFLL